MARPAGHKLSRPAWEDTLRLTGQSLTQIAELADIPRATVSSLLGQHHAASTQMAHRLAAAAGVHVATLFPTLGAPDEHDVPVKAAS